MGGVSGVHLPNLVGLSDLAERFMNAAFSFAIIRPIGQLAKTSDAVSQGNLKVSALGASFNRMYRSMAKAIEI